MPFVTLESSPLAEGRPVRIHYREFGSGEPLLILHGGWGYGVYPFDAQIEALAPRCRIVIPDRTGYGGSGRLRTLPADFHDRAATETFALMERLAIVRPVVWGHSDGAVIAVKMALAHPDALDAILLESLHYYRHKPASRPFFDAMARDPSLLGERACRALVEEHGDDYWRELLDLNGRAWLAIAERSASEPDLFAGRLPEVRTPVAVIHGARDPRTEPGELDRVRAALPHASFAILEEGRHSPHSERTTAAAVTLAATRFLDSRFLLANRRS